MIKPDAKLEDPAPACWRLRSNFLDVSLIQTLPPFQTASRCNFSRYSSWATKKYDWKYASRCLRWRPFLTGALILQSRVKPSVRAEIDVKKIYPRQSAGEAGSGRRSHPM
jgi:hypothetical protein